MAGGAAFGAAVTTVAGTFAGFMSVAGGIVGGLGILTGNKGLKKLGGIMALTGGAVGAFQGLAAAGSSAGMSGAEWGAAADSAAGATSGVFDAAGTAADVAGDAGGLNLGFEAGLEPSMQISGTQLGNGAMPVQRGAQAIEAAAAQPDLARTYAGNPAFDVKMPSLLQQAAANTTQAEIAALSKVTPPPTPSLYDRASGALKSTGEFLRNNKELVQVGGNMLSSMYGPEAEALDFRKSLMERARRNLNAPVRLKYQGG